MFTSNPCTHDFEFYKAITLIPFSPKVSCLPRIHIFQSDNYSKITRRICVIMHLGSLGRREFRKPSSPYPAGFPYTLTQSPPPGQGSYTFHLGSYSSVAQSTNWRTLPFPDSSRGLAKLAHAGKRRFIGLSNH
jgi:hypothetical protein